MIKINNTNLKIWSTVFGVVIFFRGMVAPHAALLRGLHHRHVEGGGGRKSTGGGGVCGGGPHKQAAH